MSFRLTWTFSLLATGTELKQNLLKASTSLSSSSKSPFSRSMSFGKNTSSGDVTSVEEFFFFLDFLLFACAPFSWCAMHRSFFTVGSSSETLLRWWLLGSAVTVTSASCPFWGSFLNRFRDGAAAAGTAFTVNSAFSAAILEASPFSKDESKGRLGPPMMNTLPEMEVVGVLPFDTGLEAEPELTLGQGEPPREGRTLSPSSAMLTTQLLQLLAVLLLLLLLF
uniref:Uncharacterized protein n=1 Tax=Ixodes ricinus TaxID=34613 RepID=A0A6B0V483_IXORI